MNVSSIVFNEIRNICLNTSISKIKQEQVLFQRLWIFSCFSYTFLYVIWRIFIVCRIHIIIKLPCFNIFLHVYTKHIYCLNELRLILMLRQWRNSSKWFFMPPRSKIGGAYCFCSVCHSVILSFCPLLWNFNLLITFEQWVLVLWYFTWIFPVIRPFCGYHYFLPCDLDLGVWPIFWKTLSLLITF